MRTIQIFRFLTFTFLAGLAVASAQKGAALSGTVTDPQGRPVAGAAVTLFASGADAKSRTTSDAAGAYRLEHVAPGRYLIEGSAPGFSAGRVENIHVEQGADTHVDLALELAAIAQQVVVTASGTPQTVDQVSKAVTVVDNRTIDMRDEYSLSEALRPTPGLRVEQSGGPGSFTAIRLRGLRNQDTSVLIDGMRFRDASAPQSDASGLLQDLMVTSIDRVEILRGSGSSLYGTNAIGGVINVITAQGGGRTRGNVLLEGGSLGMFRGRAQVSGGADHDRLQYSAGVSHLNVTEGVDGDDPARNTSGQGSLSIHLAPSLVLTGRLYAADSFAKLNTSPSALSGLPATGIVNAVPLPLQQLHAYEQGTPASQLAAGGATFIPSANDPDARRSGDFVAGAVSLVGNPSSQLGYSVTYQGLRTDHTFGDGPGGVGYQPMGSTASEYNGRTQTVNAQVNYQPVSMNLITAGYEFENESFSTRSVDQLAPGSNSTARVSQLSNSVFVQDQVHLWSDRLLLSGAIRAQFFGLERPSFTPTDAAPYTGVTFTAPPRAYTGDVSGAYFIRSSGTKVRVHAGRGYRAPSLYERFGSGFDQYYGYSVYGDPRLQPEHSFAIDGGVDQAFWGGRVRTSATYFYTRLQNVIIFDFSGLVNPATDPFGRFLGYANSKGGLARGVETSADLSVTRSSTISAAYTFTNAVERTPLVGDVLRSFISPRHQFSVVAGQRIGQRWLASFSMTASSNYLAPVYGDLGSRVFQFAGLKKADIGLSYRQPLGEFRAIRWFAKVDNIFHQDYYEVGFRTAGTTARGGMSFEF